MYNEGSNRARSSAEYRAHAVIARELEARASSPEPEATKDELAIGANQRPPIFGRAEDQAHLDVAACGVPRVADLDRRRFVSDGRHLPDRILRPGKTDC